LGSLAEEHVALLGHAEKDFERGKKKVVFK